SSVPLRRFFGECVGQRYGHAHARAVTSSLSEPTALVANSHARSVASLLERAYGNGGKPWCRSDQAQCDLHCLAVAIICVPSAYLGPTSADPANVDDALVCAGRAFLPAPSLRSLSVPTA